MARKAKRVAVERGLYRAGDVWVGLRHPKGPAHGPLAEGRRPGHPRSATAARCICLQAQRRPVPLRSRPLTVREVQADWFAHLDELELAGELRPRTVASYKDGVRLHFTPTFGSRQLHRSPQTTSLTGTRSNADPAPRLGRFGPAGWGSEGCSDTRCGPG